MKNHAVLEGLLRPPIELYSAAVAWAVALIALLAPWALMMPPLIGAAAAAVALWFGLARARQAARIMRYQHWMKFYRVSRVAPSKLPATPDQLYLGQGFEWTQQHTQRKRDAMQVDAKPFLRPGPVEARLRAWGQGMLTRAAQPRALLMARAIGALAAADGWLNPLHPYPDLGGSPILHGVGALDEAPVSLRQAARTGHMIVMGTTRVGKTRLLELLATQDIHAGKVVIVIDPKGDADLMLRMYAEARRAGRQDRFYLFHLGYPDISARYNGIGNFARITEVATRATNALPASGDSAAFKEFSWRFSNIVAQAQVALGRIPTYETLLRDVTSIDSLFIDYARMVFDALAAQGQYTDWRDKVASLQAQVGVKGGVPVPRSLQDRNPYEDWVKLAKGDLWTVKASASGDLVQAKLDIEKNEQAQKIGVNWVFKQRAGGVNQAPLRPVRDLSLAGYRTTLNKTTTDTASPSSADKSTRMCKAFPTEDELVKFATEVLGDRQVFTCEQGKDGCPPQSQEDTTAATGLGPKYEAEYNLVAPKLKELANTAPGANVSDAYGQLQGISAPGLTVSQQLLDALRAMPPETRAIAVDRLAQELSMHRVIDKALVTRAVLLTAMSLPEVAHAGEAMKETQQKIDRLTHYIDDLVYESRIRKELTSNTALAIMGAQSQQDSQSVLVPESKSADPNPIEGGRVKTSP
ncbi:MAG: conjugative transfer system coupling protein TraD [Desulfovibrionaceae bacterium]|nr:conjugative transfer system coupling protein TraD [Desulfovibrionaceae bacterium]